MLKECGISDDVKLIVRESFSPRKSPSWKDSKKTSFVFHKLKINHSLTYAIGPGLKRGLVTNQCYFSIFPVTKLERYPMTLGDDRFIISFSTLEGQPVSFPLEQRINRHKIDVSFIPHIGGDFLIHILFKKDYIKGSPFSINIIPQEILPLITYLYNR